MQKPMTYAAWLRSYRKLKGMTQEALAEHAGLGRTYINQIENNRISLPRQETRNRIHNVLGTSDTELLDIGILSFDEQTGEEYSPNARLYELWENERAAEAAQRTSKERSSEPATGRVHELSGASLGTSSMTADLTVTKARFIESLSDEQKALVYDLAVGIITVDEIASATPAPKAPPRRRAANE